MNDDVQLVREIGEVKAELSGLKAEVAGTNQRLDDIVITQLKDHGKRLAALDVRIAALEAAENKRAGGAVRSCWRGCCGWQPWRAHHEVLHAVDFSELSKWI